MPTPRRQWFWFYLPLILLMLLPAVSSAQRTRGLTPRSRYKTQKVVPPLRIQIDDETSLLYNAEGTFIYMGAVEELKDGRLFPSGKGLGRTVIRDSDSGESGYEYSFCSWKRGSKHGEGLLKRPDGTRAKAVWKWNQLKSVSDDPLTPEEIETLENQIARLETLLKVL